MTQPAAAAGPVRTNIDALLARYDVFFLDAYGVLVNGGGALPGAAAFLQRLRDAGKRWLLLSNDASRSIDTTYRRYQRFGLAVDPERIVTSGSILPRHFADHGLVGARCSVLGTEDSAAYVRDAGGIVVPHDDASARVCVVSDDDGYPFLEAVNDVISVLFQRIERGEPTHLLLPNPDLVFPRAQGGVGVTAGGIAAMIEAVLRLRDPAGGQRFVGLGKPHAPIFEAAMERLGLGAADRARIVMVGDQLGTDVAGAAGVGIDAAFVEGGVGRLADAAPGAALPRWLLASVAA